MAKFQAAFILQHMLTGKRVVGPADELFEADTTKAANKHMAESDWPQIAHVVVIGFLCVMVEDSDGNEYPIEPGMFDWETEVEPCDTCNDDQMITCEDCDGGYDDEGNECEFCVGEGAVDCLKCQ